MSGLSHLFSRRGILGRTSNRLVSNRFVSCDSPNDLWKASERGRKITVPKKPLINNDTKIFTMGSCFAIEIRSRLQAMGYDVFPKFDQMKFDSEHQVVGKLPEKDTLAFYTIPSMFQEISRALNGEYYTGDDFICVNEPRNAFACRLRSDIVYQDPYRRDVYARSIEKLLLLSREITDRVREGLEQADLIVITLGLIEGWKIKHNGLWACKCPVKDNDPEWEFVEKHVINFHKNKTYMDLILNKIKEEFPDKKILLTVSPVPLGRTFSNLDIVTANTQSKATLRTVAGEVCQEHSESVYYWPSFEYAMGEDVFEDDGRHVQVEHVETIVRGFIDNFREN